MCKYVKQKWRNQFRVGFIEAWGRGIEKIKDSCREAGNPMPEYAIKREEIMVMFKSLVSNTDQGTNQGVIIQ